MKILSSSIKLFEQMFPGSQYIEIPKDPEFSAFQWDDLTCSAPVCLEVQTAASSNAYEGYDYGILEEYSGSSQYDRLRNWHGPAVFALAVDGNGFHGQYNRKWHTSAGNLFLCIAQPVELPISDAENLQLLPATIIKNTLASWIGSSSDVCAEIKLPNDVVIRFKSGQKAGERYKIAGTLTEMRIFGDCITQVRYGIGVNITNAPKCTDTGHLPAIALQSIVKTDTPELDLLHFLTALLRGLGKVTRTFVLQS